MTLPCSLVARKRPITLSYPVSGIVSTILYLPSAKTLGVKLNSLSLIAYCSSFPESKTFKTGSRDPLIYKTSGNNQF